MDSSVENILEDSTWGSPTCAICLDQVRSEIRSFTYSCMHQFCYACLRKWCDIKPECPMCKSSVEAILFNIKPNGQYDDYILPPPQLSQSSHDDFDELEELDESDMETETSEHDVDDIFDDDDLRLEMISDSDGSPGSILDSANSSNSSYLSDCDVYFNTDSDSSASELHFI